MVRIEPVQTVIDNDITSVKLSMRFRVRKSLTFCFVLWNDERARLKLETFRSLASRLISLAESLTRSCSGSGRHMVLLT